MTAQLFGQSIKDLAEVYSNTKFILPEREADKARQRLHDAIDDQYALFVAANEQHEISGRLLQESVKKEIALTDEVDRLKGVIRSILHTLDEANSMPGGPISDTIWHSPSETLFDYIATELDKM